MGKSGREGIGVSEQHSSMDRQVRKGGNQSKQVALKKDGQGRKGIGASKSTHLWMSKSGGEGIRASKWHSPMDGQVREEGNQSKQASSTHQRRTKGGRDQSKQG